MLKCKRFKFTVEPAVRAVADIIVNTNTGHVTVSGYFEARGGCET